MDLDQLITEVIIDDSKATPGAQRVVAAMQGMAAAGAKAEAATQKQTSALNALAGATVQLVPAQRSAFGVFERWAAVADQNERAFQQMVRAENQMTRAMAQGHGSAERMQQILDGMWRKTIGAADAAQQHAVALERERAAADKAQSTFNALVGVQESIGSSAKASAAAFEPLLDQLEREAELLRLIDQERGKQAADNAQSTFNGLAGVQTDIGKSARDAAAAFEPLLARLEAEEELLRGINVERQRQVAQNAQNQFNDLVGVQTEIGNSARLAAQAFEPLIEQLEREQALLQMINQERARQHGENAQAAFNAQLGVRPGSGSGTAAVSASVFQQEEALQRQAQLLADKHDIAGAATRRYAEALAIADDALAANRISAEQHQRILQGEKIILDQTTGSQFLLGRSMRLTGWHMQQLSFQINDVVTGLALGQPPLQVLLQQGGQIAQIFPMAFKAMATFTGGAIALAAVIGGTLIAAFFKGQSEAAAFQRAMQLTGNAAGVTTGQLEELVDVAADASNIGAGAARAIATQMVATGKIGGEVIGKLLALVEDYAAATDASTEEAGAALQKLFVDPTKGAKELDEAYNLLTDAQKRYIQTLSEQGRRTEAQVVLADSLNDRTRNLATDGLGWLERAWNSVAGAASDAWDSMKGIGRPETLEEQIEDARSALTGRAAIVSPSSRRAAQEELDNLLQQKAARDAQAAADARDASLRSETKVLGDVSRGYDTMVSKQHELENQAIRFGSAIDEIRQKMAGIRDDGGAQGPLAELQRDLELLEQGASDTALALGALRTPLQESQAQTAISRRLSGLTPGARTGESAFLTTLDSAAHGSPEDARQAVAMATDARTRALIEQNTAINDNNAITAMSIRFNKDLGAAYLEAGGIALKVEADRMGAQQAFQTGANAELQARLALNDAAAKGYADGAKQLRQLEKEAETREKIAAAAGGSAAAVGAAELAGQIDTATRSLRDYAAAAEAAGDSELSARINATADGIADAMARIDSADRTRRVNESLRGQREQLELAQAELGLVQSTNDEHDVAIALLQAKLDLQRMQVDAASAEGQAYLQNAEALARTNNELRQARRERQELDNFLDDAIDKTGEFAANIAKGTASFQDLRDVGEEVLNELIDLFIELAYKNPLKNALELSGDTGRPTLESVGNMLTGATGTPAAGQGGGNPLTVTTASGVPGVTKGTFADPVFVTVTNGGMGGGGGGMGGGGMGGGGMGGGGMGGGGFPTSTYSPDSTWNAGMSTYGSAGAEPGADPASFGGGSFAPGAGAGSSFNMMGAGIGAGIGGTAGYFLGDAIGGKTGGTIGAILGTLLGAFLGASFENGGIMTSRGPMGLRRYEGGGIADSPQLAIYGEGRMPEAYVPLPDGRSIPVTMNRGIHGRGGAENDNSRMGSRVNIRNTFVLPPQANGFGRSPQQQAGMVTERMMRSIKNTG